MNSNNNNNNNNNDDDDKDEDEKKSNIKDEDFDGKLLHLACIWNNSELLSDLLLGDEIKFINSQDSMGRTALHEAIISNSIECAHLLLLNGANSNILPLTQLDDHRQTKCCLHLAVEKLNISMIKLLIEFNVNLYQRDSDTNMMAIDLAKYLYQNNNEDEKIKLFLNELIKIYNEYELNIYKSLTIAVHKGNVDELIKIINGTGLNINNDNDNKYIKKIINFTNNNTNNTNNTLLMKACQDGHQNIVEKLLELGADDRINMITKYSPLYIASYNGRLEICKLLLQKFPHLVQVSTVENWLPIHAATINNHLDIVKLLINYEYPMNIMRPFVVKLDNDKSLKNLKNSKNSNDSNCDNNNNDNNDENKFIYFMPFDLNAQDIVGQTILYMSTLSGNYNMVEYLLNLRLNTYQYNDYIMNLFNDDIDHYEDCISSNNSSQTNSSPDITVISTINKDNDNSSQYNTQLNNKDKGDDLSDDTHQRFNNDNLMIKNELIENLLNNKTATTNEQLKIYKINPLIIDLYCNNETSLHCAVKKKYYSLASLLLERGADPNKLIYLSNNQDLIQPPSPSPTIITRVSHFNNDNEMNEIIKQKNKSFDDLKFLINDNQNKSENNNQRMRSTAIREAIKNRDRSMFDLLLRFGANDNIDDNNGNSNNVHNNNNNQDNNNEMNALEIAIKNQDIYFISKLLSLKSFNDLEYQKINKKFNNLNLIINNNTSNNLIKLSQIYPTNTCMIQWNQLKITKKFLQKQFNQLLQKHLQQWLCDSSLIFNIKLKLNNQLSNNNSNNTALAAITRIDLSDNNLYQLPQSLFTCLPSLKILNLSKNKLQTLPEVNCDLDNGIDDGITNDFTNDGKKSKMRKSQSVTSSLSTTKNTGMKKNLKKLQQDDHELTIWNLPFLEELYLQDNQLEYLPLSMFQQPELKIIDLSNNKLRTIPSIFWFSPKLSELNLSMNLLCDLPSPINYLKKFNTNDDLSRTTMSKSISTSSISSNLSSEFNLIELNSSMTTSKKLSTTPSTTSSTTNLISFELTIIKPWFNSLTIINNSEQQFDPKDKIMINDELNKSDTMTSSSTTTKQQQQFQCSSLQQLNLSHNGFDHIPSPLSCLAQKLTHLNLSYNRLTKIFDQQLLLGHFPQNLRHLDLSNNQINNWYCIDDVLSDNESVDYQIIDYNNDDLSMLNDGTCLHNYLRQSKSSSCCPYKQHKKLENLKTLILSNNNLKELIITRDELIEWINKEMKSLNEPSSATINRTLFSFNLIGHQQQHPQSQHSKLLSALRLFTSFENNNQNDDELLMMKKSNSIDDLNNKSLVDLDKNKHKQLFFSQLSMLDISKNQLSIIPKTISLLKQLSVLNLSDNKQLKQLPPEMGLLQKLWNLNTRGCLNLQEPLRTMIENKSSYKTYDIISYLNSILENSKPYTRLKLMLVGYQNIGKTSLLEQLRMEGINPKLNRLNHDQQQLNQHHQQQQQHDHWCKRVGNNNNKTIKSVKGSSSQTLSTVGVDLCEWIYEKKPLKNTNLRDRSLSRTRIVQMTKNSINQNTNQSNNNIGPITFRTWDFGGQREYYATHQYFLSKRSIYLAIWKITDGEKGIIGLNNWLVNIQSRAPNSPVIIVGTHYDLVKEFYPPFYSNELQNIIRERYMCDQIDSDKRGLPKIVASIEVSTKTRYNIRLLANIIYDTACEMRTTTNSGCGKERLLEQKVPSTYLALEEIVNQIVIERKLMNLEPVLYTEQYRQEVTNKMREKYDLKFRDYNELHQATRFLHENGVLLHYEDTNLKDLYFLDPQWLCDILAHVVTIKEINPFVKNGLMKTEQLLQLFKHNNLQLQDNNIQNYIINLLNKFELAITWDNRTILIPSLLPTEEQLKMGQLGYDIAIPLRSRLKIHHHNCNINNETIKFTFKNDLFFQEFTNNNSGEIDQNNNNNISINVWAKSQYNKSINRLLLLSYIPCGFWSRLIARILGDESIIDIVRSIYQLPMDIHNDEILINFLNNIKTYWHCWQTGFGLRYLDTFLLRVKEFSLIKNNQNGQNFEKLMKKNQSSNNNLNNKWKNLYSYPYDYNRMKFFLRQKKESSDKNQEEYEWNELDLKQSSNGFTSTSTLIEIYLPNQLLNIDINYYNKVEKIYKKHHYQLETNVQQLTKLLVIIVEHIDTLLEDWYPSLGTRFIHTSDGKFLITRLIPCIYCLQDFIIEFNNNKDNDLNKDKDKDEILSPDTTDIDKNLIDFYKNEVKNAIKLNNTVDVDTNNKIMNKNYYRINVFMVEECILSIYNNNDTNIGCLKHGRLRLEKIAPDFLFYDLNDNYRINHEQLKFGKLLGRGSFGFVFRAYYRPKLLPASQTTSTQTQSMNSKFYLNDQNQNQKNYDVAIKLLQPIDLITSNNNVKCCIRKTDIDVYNAMKSKWKRDPLQYSSKAYFTARNELNILLNLKHKNIASIIGICTKPLALILTLAPYGSLDVHIRQYRQSGQRISPSILQKTFLQISKALEYLHQQHIIYRDLKSENVLVWSFPLPPSNYNFYCNVDDDVHLKLADYGISRSSLPTGTKGFGGTEGFMAPEIMLFNGEEEYTEKVDCFSFAMFMYELSTLRFPFEGQEFAIRESILDGIRPSITKNDLDYLPESFIDLMTRSWAHEPNDRPNMSQIVSIISAPEFCSLRDVATLSDNSSLICAIGFQKFDSINNDYLNNNHNQRKKYGIFLSKIGKQIDFLEIIGSKWTTIGQHVICENLQKRTITSSCIVNQNQLWLGDSNAIVNIYCFTSSNNEDNNIVDDDILNRFNQPNNNQQQDLFILLCMIKFDFDNPITMIAIKSIIFIEKLQLILININNGDVWLIELEKLMKQLEQINIETLTMTISSTSLGLKKIDNNNIPIFCMSNIAIKSSNKTINIENDDLLYYDLWLGQIEGQIIILTIKCTTFEIVRQITIDHYSDRNFNQSSFVNNNNNTIPISERNDVFLLIGTNNNNDGDQPFIYSVLYSGYIIYQWDVKKKLINHKLDCSKLAPCSESLMSISIEDHLKPGNCKISEIAINNDNDEIYIGTNFGCIIVAELKSLKPITVFRPYQREVKFIITLNNNHNKNDKNNDNQMINDNEQNEIINNNENKDNQRKDFSLSSSIKNIWPFNKTSSYLKSSNNNTTILTNTTTTNINNNQNDQNLKNVKKRKQIQPFITIGRGYRNLLDRFTNTTDSSQQSSRTNKDNDTIDDNNNQRNIKLNYSSQFHAIIWDSGFWNFS